MTIADSLFLFVMYRSKLVENYSKPTIANFGRSLFGGYCPTYVPDFVLHGMPSDEKLRQSLMAELSHAVQVRARANIAHIKHCFFFVLFCTIVSQRIWQSIFIDQFYSD